MTQYLTAEQVLFIHARLIDETGGTHGVRDIGLLASAVARPQATFEGNEMQGWVRELLGLCLTFLRATQYRSRLSFTISL